MLAGGWLEATLSTSGRSETEAEERLHNHSNLLSRGLWVHFHIALVTAEQISDRQLITNDRPESSVHFNIKINPQ